jgi:hypothetical protein
MLETLLIIAGGSILAPVLRRICEGNSRQEETRDDTDHTIHCDPYHSDNNANDTSTRSGGERQTTLSEYGFDK